MRGAGEEMDVPEPAVFLQLLQWQMWPRRFVKSSESSTLTWTAPQLQCASMVVGLGALFGDARCSMR